MAKFLSRRSYRVGKSRTGLGLFATVPIKKGTKIIRYWGPVLPAKIADEIENKYMFEINSRWTIDGSIRRNTARYINHACRPNAESDVVGHLVFIRAIRNIEPGDEITYDYGKNYFNTFLKPIGCKCNSCEAKRKSERAEARAKARRAKERAARKAAVAKAIPAQDAPSRSRVKKKVAAKVAVKAPVKAGGKSLKGPGGKAAAKGAGKQRRRAVKAPAPAQTRKRATSARARAA